MAEQWEAPSGENKVPGGNGLNRNALQATLADLVREADGPRPSDAPPVTGTGRPVVPGAQVPVPSPAPRPLRGPIPARPDPADAAAAVDPQAGPVTGGGAPRPAAPGRPRLPFGPEPTPAPHGSAPVGTVRPGSGVPGGFNPPGAGASLGGNGLGGNGIGGGNTLGPGSLSAGSLGGRITPGDLGDNLARLAPTATEQPTIPLRKRPKGGEGRGDSAPEGDAAAGKAPVGAPPAPAPRPAAVIEAWSPHFDDILPQRPSRSGRARRRAR